MTAILTAGAPSHKAFENLPWQEIKAQVHRLQMRIAKATREGRKGKVRALQRLLTHSFYAKCLAVKRVVQNKGSNTPGVDKVLWRTSRQRMQAVKELGRQGYHPLPLRRIYIPKKAGSKEKRPLSIPCMKDRAMQALWQLALSPIAEEWADPNSYGFRPKRSAHDAISQCFNALSKKQSAPWIFEGDIRACFDRLSHTWLEEHIPMDKTILRKFLKAGVMEEDVVYSSSIGAPQGGIISPTLLVMALSGLEFLLKKRWPNRKVNTVIYADDFIVTGVTQELLEQEVVPAIREFLLERGLEISETKSKISHIDEGFNFLGFHMRKYKGRLLIKPSKGSIKHFLEEVRTLIKTQGNAKTENLIRLLNPKILGWANFFCHATSSRVFSKIDKEIFMVLQRWIKRRHPTKNGMWRYKRYFRQAGLRTWQFTASVKREGELFPHLVDLVWMKSVSIKRYVKIKGCVTPFNPAFKEYFELRESFLKEGRKQRNRAVVIRQLSSGLSRVR